MRGAGVLMYNMTLHSEHKLDQVRILFSDSVRLGARIAQPCPRFTNQGLADMCLLTLAPLVRGGLADGSAI